MLLIRNYRAKKAMPARSPGREVLMRQMLGRFRYGLFCPGKMDVNKAYSGLEGPEKEADGRRRMKRPGKIDVNRAHVGLGGSINRETMEGGGWKGKEDGRRK